MTALNGARTSEFYIRSLIKYLHSIYYVPGTELLKEKGILRSYLSILWVPRKGMPLTLASKCQVISPVLA